MFQWLLFAQNRAGGSPFAKPDLIWGSVGLAAALLVGAAVIYFVDKWRKQAVAGPAGEDDPSDFRAMFKRGELTEAEYNKLRENLAARVKPKPAASPVPPQAPGPFPPGYFDDPPTSPPTNSSPPAAPGGTAPSA
ncbi:MAG TPA: hypothetical protein VN641_22915 [Urbifossiella sp.]|nr:hypothetical protein [Urbifossiella sp.]